MIPPKGMFPPKGQQVWNESIEWQCKDENLHNSISKVLHFIITTYDNIAVFQQFQSTQCQKEWIMYWR